jgi:hypothetical protein
MSKLPKPPADEQTIADIIAATEVWLERAVIGLNLCPFAKSVHVKKQIRYVVSQAETAEDLQLELVRELEHLAEANPETLDTTLFIHPWVLTDFYDFNDFLEVADETLIALELDGILQIANLHPDYQFADSEPQDIENYTNRSPYPTLHLLREESIDRAVDAFPDAASIYERNIETMRKLGREGWRQLFLEPVPKK